MDKELLLELKDKLPDLLDNYQFDYGGSDYKCVFCGNRAKFNSELVQHYTHCLGIKLQKALDNLK
jgi:hypothetical protein